MDTANINPSSFTRFGKQQWGFYGQDSWKVTRKLTLDLGLRYDYMRYYQEQHGRSPNFSPTLANPTAGGHPGAVIYQATCSLQFREKLPAAFGPRLGLAYQVAPKTVLRGGLASPTPAPVSAVFARQGLPQPAILWPPRPFPGSRS